MRLQIAKIGNPILRHTTKVLTPAEIKSKQVQEFIDDMIETMRVVNGAGLAANQVFKSWKLFVVEVKNNPRYPYKPEIPLTVVINPEITFLTQKRFQNYEGCLSVPAIRGVVERCPVIRLRGLNRNAEPIDQVIKGISAGTFQHENDHLEGLLFTDSITNSKTLTTWEDFKLFHEQTFIKTVEKVVSEYGS